MIGVLPIGQLPDKAQKLAALFLEPQGCRRSRVAGDAPRCLEGRGRGDLAGDRPPPWPPRPRGPRLCALRPPDPSRPRLGRPRPCRRQLPRGEPATRPGGEHGASRCPCPRNRRRALPPRRGAGRLLRAFADGMLGLYQLASFLFTPAYQSDSRWLPVCGTGSRGPYPGCRPSPRLLAALVAGKLGWPFGAMAARPQEAAALAPAPPEPRPGRPPLRVKRLRRQRFCS